MRLSLTSDDAVEQVEVAERQRRVVDDALDLDPLQPGVRDAGRRDETEVRQPARREDGGDGRRQPRSRRPADGRPVIADSLHEPCGDIRPRWQGSLILTRYRRERRPVHERVSDPPENDIAGLARPAGRLFSMTSR